MLELTKSLMSYTWAMSVFGLQQLFNIVAPTNNNGGDASKAFNNITDATTQTFGKAMKQTFEAGDSVQREFVDLLFGGLASGGLDPGPCIRFSRDAVRQAVDATFQTVHSATRAGEKPSTPGTDSPSGGSWGPIPR